MAGTPTWVGPTNQLLEMPDSPVYDLGQTNPTCTRTYMGPHALVLASILPRGTVGTGVMAGWIVTRCNAARQRGALGKLVITYGANGTASGQQLPPDEFNITPFEVNPRLELNKRYQAGGFMALTDADFQIIDTALKAFDKPGTTNITLTGAQQDLFNKKKRGTTNFYLAGFKYTWTRSYYLLTGVANVGGYIETPGGPLASFIPYAFSSLRQADDIKWTGALYKYTQSWLTAPAGHFDPDLY